MVTASISSVVSAGSIFFFCHPCVVFQAGSTALTVYGCVVVVDGEMKQWQALKRVWLWSAAGAG